MPTREEIERALEYFLRQQKYWKGYGEGACYDTAVAVLQSALKPWQPIDSAPDGKDILTIKRIPMTDRYYQAEVIYRNGEYWFKNPGERAIIPDLWMHLPEGPEGK